MTKEDFYRNERFCKEARAEAVSPELVDRYARQLHAARDVVADLKFAHEANAADYSDDDFAALGGEVSALIRRTVIAAGFRPSTADSRPLESALCDFNGWYLERVIYGGDDFEESLREHRSASPFIIGSRSS